MRKEIKWSMNNVKNLNNVTHILHSSITNRVIKHKVAQNTTKRKRSVIRISQWKEKNGRDSQKIRNLAKKVRSRTTKNNIWILKSKRTDFSKW